MGEHGPKCTSGHVNTYFQFDHQSKPLSKLKKREVQKRAKGFDAVANLYSGGSTEDKELIYEHLLRSDKEVFSRVLQRAG